MTPIDKELTAPTASETSTKPKLIKNMAPAMPIGPLDFMNLSGHNTYRPDIYRTSEGYLY